MKLRVATPRDGLQWMLSGVRLARQQTLGLAGLFGMMVFGLALFLGLPWIGPILVAMLLPALTAGWVDAAAAVEAGGRPLPSHLIGPLRSPARTALLQLGGLNALASFVLLLLADALDPGMADAWSVMRDSETTAEATLDAIGALQQGMVLRAVLLLPLVLTIWHAPVIIVRTGAGLGKALFHTIVTGGAAALVTVPSLIRASKVRRSESWGLVSCVFMGQSRRAYVAHAS